MKKEQLFNSPEFWTAEIQMELFRQIQDFMLENNISKSELAKRLNCSKGYVTQLLNGDFDHKISTFVKILLAIGKVPVFSVKNVRDLIEDSKPNSQNKHVISQYNSYPEVSLVSEPSPLPLKN